MKKETRMNKIESYTYFITVAFALIISVNLVSAAADFQVSSFSCSPSEVVVNSGFSCSATIMNNGDVAGSVSIATLYPDATNWLESSNYPQASGTSVNPGQTTEITFTGLNAIKSGNNGFSKIMLDSVTDTYVADNNKKVNSINVAVLVSNSASSAMQGASITTTADVTAGGNIDVSLTFTSTSGGCNIGSQSNPKSISGMTDGSRQSRTWTITQGTSGNCRFSVSAAATGTGGVASKIDTTISTITCTDCSSGSGPSSAGGGGGGGGGIAKVYSLGELISSRSVELLAGEKSVFNLSGVEHTLTLKSHTETTAKITIQSSLQTFEMTVGDEINVDLDGDGSADVSIKLKSINIINLKAEFILTPLASGSRQTPSITGGVISESGEDDEKGIISLLGTTNKVLFIGIIFFIILAVASILYYLKIKRDKKWGGRI
ncbi:MAG: hypothetical protein ABH840_02625 [Nanoarchaeota archaeon]